MSKHPVFDRAPKPIARFFGHLHAYLGRARVALYGCSGGEMPGGSAGHAGRRLEDRVVDGQCPLPERVPGGAAASPRQERRAGLAGVVDSSTVQSPWWKT